MEHPRERADLVAALRAAGPGAPTLCEGWRTEHLAAHVVLRESTVATAAGIVVRPLAGRTERETRRLGDRSTDPAAWAALLVRVAHGPPRWHPMRWAGDGAQLAELFVHTEDVRRAAPDPVTHEPAQPRRLPARHVDALWTALARSARLLVRRSPVPVVLRRPDGPSVVAGPRRSAAGPVTVVGEPGELLLWVFDRSRVAHVALEGAPEDVERLTRYRPARTA